MKKQDILQELERLYLIEDEIKEMYKDLNRQESYTLVDKGRLDAINHLIKRGKIIV